MQQKLVHKTIETVVIKKRNLHLGLVIASLEVLLLVRGLDPDLETNCSLENQLYSMRKRGKIRFFQDEVLNRWHPSHTFRTQKVTIRLNQMYHLREYTKTQSRKPLPPKKHTSHTLARQSWAQESRSPCCPGRPTTCRRRPRRPRSGGCCSCSTWLCKSR